MARSDDRSEQGEEHEDDATARPRRGRLSAHGQDRRDDIVKQAEILFAEHGYADTRMTDIADAVGITKGLLYWYFDSKEALIAEILVDLRARLRAVQHEAVSGLADPLARIYVSTVASVHFIVEHFRLYSWIAFAGSGAISSESARSAAVHATDAATNIAEGQRLGLIRVGDDPTELALTGTGIVDRVCLLAHRGNIEGGTDAAAHLAARYLVRGLAASDEIAAAIETAHGAAPATASGPRAGTRRVPAPGDEAAGS